MRTFHLYKHLYYLPHYKPHTLLFTMSKQTLEQSNPHDRVCMNMCSKCKWTPCTCTTTLQATYFTVHIVKANSRAVHSVCTCTATLKWVSQNVMCSHWCYQTFRKEVMAVVCMLNMHLHLYVPNVFQTLHNLFHLLSKHTAVPIPYALQWLPLALLLTLIALYWLLPSKWVATLVHMNTVAPPLNSPLGIHRYAGRVNISQDVSGAHLDPGVRYTFFLFFLVVTCKCL